MKSLDDLRRRLGPKRRVFALFHPLLPNEPLVILHVHLESRPDLIPSCMTHVFTDESDNNDNKSNQPLSPRTATFYSISNTQHGLSRGLGLGEFLIKNAVKALRQEFPVDLETFVTLSPMPGFRKWVEGLIVPNTESDDSYNDIFVSRMLQLGNFSPEGLNEVVKARPMLQQLLHSTSQVTTDENNNNNNNSPNNRSMTLEHQLESLKPTIMILAAHYLIVAKNRKSGKPLDPVAGFHIHNGAEVFRINFAADLSRKGLLRSFGVMANYRYRSEEIERNKASLESSHYAHIPMSASVRSLLGGEDQ